MLYVRERKQYWNRCILLCVLVALHGVATARQRTSDLCGAESSSVDVEGCEVNAKGHTLVCNGGLHKNIWGSTKVRVLTLCRWPNDTFDPQAIMTLFPGLQKLSVIDGDVTRLTSDFPATSRSLETVNMSSLRLEKLPESTFSKLRSLRVLDLRWNRLTHLDPRTISRPPLLHTIYLAGSAWNCSQDLTWLVDAVRNSSVASRVVDRHKMNCSDVIYPAKPIVPVMTYIKTLQAECPQDPPDNCTCWMSNIVWSPSSPGLLWPVITVDCSQQGLTELPASLPAHTTTLIVKGNKITGLKPLVNNPHYSHVSDIYLDDNDIESVAILEGADWLLNFRVLSLRANHISELPTYAFDNALQSNNHAVNIFLGGNPWRCDCLFTPDFQDLLIKYLILVKDIHDIQCSFAEGDDNSMMEVRELSRSAVCSEPNEYFIRPLDMLNAILALLIVLIIGKLCYDYWSFKKTGKLPWIVAKMP